MRYKANRGVAIGVENLRKSRKFYEETLGLRLVEKGPGRAVYDAGHLSLYIMEGEPHPPVLSFTAEGSRCSEAAASRGRLRHR